jgi:catalase
LEADSLPSKGADYLFDELTERITREPIKFRILVQLADDSDVVDDATVHWPANRQLFDLGMLTLTEAAQDDDPEIKRIIFDPIPRVDGIEPSADPLLELRAAIYLLSGRRRRSAAQTAKN